LAAPATADQTLLPSLEPPPAIEPIAHALDVPLLPAIELASSAPPRDSSEPSAAMAEVAIRKPNARHRQRFVQYSPTLTEPAPASQATAVGVTALPELKPPPLFGDEISSTPVGDGKTGGAASDNPYVDGTQGAKPSGDPNVDAGRLKMAEPAKDESSPGF